jgi:hypothetical protein
MGLFLSAPGLMPPSDPIAGLPDEKNESSNQPNDDKHPVLDVETQKSETLNQKPHCCPPRFSAG